MMCLANNIVEDTIDIRNGCLFLIRTSLDKEPKSKSYIVRKMNASKGREVLSFEETDVLASKMVRFLENQKTISISNKIEFLLIKRIFKKKKIHMGNQVPVFSIKINADGSIKQAEVTVYTDIKVPQKKMFKVLSKIVDDYVFDNYKTFELPDKYKYLDNEGCAFSSRIRYNE